MTVHDRTYEVTLAKHHTLHNHIIFTRRKKISVETFTLLKIQAYHFRFCILNLSNESVQVRGFLQMFVNKLNFMVRLC